MAEPTRPLAIRPEYVGPIAQVLGVIGLCIGIWYGLVSEVQSNSRDIEANRKAIEEIKQGNERMMEQLQLQGDRREERMLRHINEMKGNINWLVRRQVDKETAQ